MEAAASGDSSDLSDDYSSDDDDGGGGFFSAVMDGIFGGIFSRGSDEDASPDGAGGLADEDGHIVVPLDAAYVHPFNGPIEHIARFDLGAISFENRRNHFSMFFAGGILYMEPGSLPDQALDGAWLLGFGFAYRRYFNDPHTLFSPYAAGSIGLDVLGWSYRNPIFHDGDEIESDTLLGLTGYAGLGVAIRRNHRLSGFVEVGIGGTVLGGETAKGFTNDVFDDYGFLSVKAGLTLRF